MRILLDESAPQKLRLLIGSDHSVATVAFQGWSGLTNGGLLDVAEEAGFDLLITADQNMRHQQNLTGRRLALLVLSTNNWSLIQQHISKILVGIEGTQPSQFVFIDIGYARG
ncbi:MAG TPA: DUF5615 family PIN-like protein [Bryobacteraceae bacterium]|nr:DUF5615 family PIN-like protein [Bryobacteraceae bacterium]